MKVERVSAAEAVELLDQLAKLLIDAVESGASIGFLLPLSMDGARNYWQVVIDHLETSHILFVAKADELLVGTVQLLLENRPNGNHRGEVAKLMVHTSCRGRGVAQALMGAIEECAKEHGRSTLVLDTRASDPSEMLYRKLGYLPAGVIPEYARSTDGKLHSTIFMYKLLH